MVLLYVVDDSNNRVQVFSPTGAFISTFGSTGSASGQFNGADAVAIAPNGNIYVAEFFNGRVQIFTPLGTSISSITGLTNPTSVAINSSGTVYIGDINNHVNVYNSSGVFQTSFGSTGSANGQFNSIGEMSIAPSGSLYVPEQTNNRVQVLSSTGIFQTVYGSLGSSNGLLNGPTGVAVASSGYSYVVDRNNSRVEVFTPANAFQSTFGSAGSNAGQFSFDNSSYIAVAPTGFVYVGDQVNNRIQRLFDPNAWTAGTDNFTNASTGPTSLGVGTGQILGQNFNLTSAIGLTMSGNLTVNSGGTFMQSGGPLNAAALNISSRYVYQGGNVNLIALTVNSGGIAQANMGGSIALSNSFSVLSTMTLDGGVSISAVSANVGAGGFLNVGNASISATSFVVSSGGQLQLNNPVTSFVSSLNVFGLVTGGGFVNGSLIIQPGAQVSVPLGQTFTVNGSTIGAGLLTVAGGTAHFIQAYTNGSGAFAGSIQGFGTLRFDGGLTNPANSSLSLAGSASVFGNITNNANATIHLQGTQPNVFFNNITNNGSILIDKNASATFFGAISGNAPSASISLLQGSSASLAATHAAIATSMLSLAGSSDNWSASLDLNNNALVLESTPATKSAALSTLRNQVAFATSNPDGITSTGLPANMALATLDNAITHFATFFGQPADANSLLVAPELLGDANADGHVDLSDLSTVLNNFGTTTTAWTSGNFDGASAINLTDLSAVLNNLPVNANNAAAFAVLSAPEPASLSLSLPLMAWMSRSRLRSRRR